LEAELEAVRIGLRREAQGEDLDGRTISLWFLVSLTQSKWAAAVIRVVIGAVKCRIS
jgi:hypothetical protein